MDKTKKKLPATIWALGFVSLFMDTSSEIVHGLLPVFLVSLGASYSMVGLIEGVGESSSLILKIFSGPLSDWWGDLRCYFIDSMPQKNNWRQHRA